VKWTLVLLTQVPTEHGWIDPTCPYDTASPCIPCRYLEQEKALFKNRSTMRVLELGAGLGLAGIVAALQVSQSLGPSVSQSVSRSVSRFLRL